MRHSRSAEMGAASATQRTAARGRSGIGRLVPRLPVLCDLRLGARLRSGSPLLLCAAARSQAAPRETGHAMRQPVDVLLDGGAVRAPQGGGARVEIQPARDWRVRRKLEQDRRLIDELIRTGDRVMAGGRADPGYAAGVTKPRVLGRRPAS